MPTSGKNKEMLEKQKLKKQLHFQAQLDDTEISENSQEASVCLLYAHAIAWATVATGYYTAETKSRISIGRKPKLP